MQRRLRFYVPGFLISVSAVCLLFGATSKPVGPTSSVIYAEQSKQAWVEKCLQDFQKIRPGVTKAEIDKLMQLDGGFLPLSKVHRYVHPECHFFKIDVEYNVKRARGSDKALHVSKPYIEEPYYD